MTEQQITELMQMLISTGEMMATEVWRLALQRSYWVGAQALGFVVLCAVVVLKAIKFKNGVSDDDFSRDEKIQWSWLVIVVLALLGYLVLGIAIDNFFNSEWMAIERIFYLVSGGG